MEEQAQITRVAAGLSEGDCVLLGSAQGKVAVVPASALRSAGKAAGLVSVSPPRHPPALPCYSGKRVAV